jgi:hypothetical protein
MYQDAIGGQTVRFSLLWMTDQLLGKKGVMSQRQRVRLYFLAWNEETMLPFSFGTITIWLTGSSFSTTASTDATLALLAREPRALVLSFTDSGDSFVPERQ